MQVHAENVVECTISVCVHVGNDIHLEVILGSVVTVKGEPDHDSPLSDTYPVVLIVIIQSVLTTCLKTFLVNSLQVLHVHVCVNKHVEYS